MNKKNARTLGVRLDAHDTERLEKFEKETSIEGVSLARASLKAALDCYFENGEISVPIKLVIASKHEAQTVKPGQTTKTAPPAGSYSNIKQLPPQHLAADDQESADSAPPPQNQVNYGSGKRRKKGA
jgi:hypothetical protein